jgi:hypothetical protein
MYVDLIGDYQKRYKRGPSGGAMLSTEVAQRHERERQQKKAQRNERRRAAERLRYRRKRERELAARETAPERTRAALIAMPKDERISYELEGALPMTLLAGASDEDLDPTPVPRGCPSCWRTGDKHTGGEICIRCPDPEAHARRRQEYGKGLVLGAT